MNENRRNLIIAAVGDTSQHQSWISSGARRSFDLALIYYGGQRGAFRADADIYVERKGFKFPLIADLLDELGSCINHYEYVWLPDDDIAADADEINRLLEIA